MRYHIGHDMGQPMNIQWGALYRGHPIGRRASHGKSFSILQLVAVSPALPLATFDFYCLSHRYRLSDYRHRYRNTDYLCKIILFMYWTIHSETFSTISNATTYTTTTVSPRAKMFWALNVLSRGAIYSGTAVIL